MSRLKINCEITKVYGVIGLKKDKLGRPCEVRLSKVSWQGSEPTWDLRPWDCNGTSLRGITMTDDMMRNLKELLNGIDTI